MVDYFFSCLGSVIANPLPTNALNHRVHMFMICSKVICARSTPKTTEEKIKVCVTETVE